MVKGFGSLGPPRSEKLREIADGRAKFQIIYTPKDYISAGNQCNFINFWKIVYMEIVLSIVTGVMLTDVRYIIFFVTL